MKKKYIIPIIVVAVIGAILIYKFVPNSSTNSINTKNLKEEYTLLQDDNVYKYVELNEVMKIFDNGTGIIFFGFPECKWCQHYVVHLNDLAIKYKVNEIKYYNIKAIRENKTEDYKKMVSKLEKLLPYDEYGNRKIFVPTVVFIKNGELIALDNETATINEGEPEDYWTEENLDLFDSKMSTYFEKYTDGICTSCN